MAAYTRPATSLFLNLFRNGCRQRRVVAETRRDRGFCFGAFATEEPGEGNKHISNRSTRGATEQGRDVQASLRGRFPRNGWADGETVQRIAARIFDGDVLIFHFYTDFQALVRQKKGSSRPGENPFASTVSASLFRRTCSCPTRLARRNPGQGANEIRKHRDFRLSALFFLLFFSSFSRRRLGTSSCRSVPTPNLYSAKRVGLSGILFQSARAHRASRLLFACSYSH